MTEEIIEVTIDKLIGVSPDGAAVFLKSTEKTFVIFIGSTEGEALARAVQEQDTPRPLTHDLLRSILIGFDLKITKVIISEILDSAFCSTLVLVQTGVDKDDLRSEVRIDCRPSDAFVLSARLGFPIHVSRSVLDQVNDVTDLGIADIPFPDFPPISEMDPTEDEEN